MGATVAKFDVAKTSVPGLLTISPKPIHDDRGWFMRTFAAEELAGYGIDHTALVEANQSRSHRGVVRGLHTRADTREAKLVRVARGRIYDVVVDLRPTSPAFGSWLGFELDDESHQQLYIPGGCAHGFQALSDVADVCYQVSAAYDPSLDAAVAWDDPDIGVRWPLADATVSARDRQAPSLAEIRPRLDEWFGAADVA
jgi:dTDP-4-dehydrorhamnose 3,5-epimerase